MIRFAILLSPLLRPDSAAGDPLLPGLVIGLWGPTHEGQHLSKQSHYVGILLSLNIYSELDVQFQISGRHHLTTKWASQPGSSKRGPWRWDTMECNLISVWCSPFAVFCGSCLITQCPGSPERRGPDPGAWSREDVTGGSPLGTLSHGPASHNNFTKFNILQPNLISDNLQISIQDTTTTTTRTPTIKFKTRPKSKSKSENFEKNQSLAERNYRLLRQKYNKKARSTTSKTTKVTTPTTTKYVPTTTTEQT